VKGDESVEPSNQSVEPIINTNEIVNVETSKCNYWIQKTKDDLKGIYSDFNSIKWSIWWALCFCGVLSFEGYASSIWYAIDPTITFNGFCDSLTRLLGTLGSIFPNYVRNDILANWGEPMTFISTILSLVMSVVMFSTTNVYVSYVMTGLFSLVMYFILALAAAQLALGVKNGKYALIFGINTFAGLVLQTVVQIICSSLGYDIYQRFQFYAGFFLFVAILLLFSLLTTLGKRCHSLRRQSEAELS